MKLKTYIIPDFKTIEVRSERNYCDIAQVSVGTTDLGGGTGETDELDASIFRDGIWDED